MTSNTRPDFALLPLFERALSEELGIVVYSPQPKDLREKLYATRSAIDRPEFRDLIIFLLASNDKIFIAKKSVELEP